MKRFLFAVMLLVGVVVLAFPSDTVYQSNLINGSITNSTLYPLDCSQNGIDYLSFQAVYSTEAYNESLFNDGVKSTGTITISSNTAVVGSTLTIQGIQYAEGVEWTANVTYSSMTAQSLFNILVSTYGLYSSGTIVVASTGTQVGSTYTLNGTSFSINGTYYVCGNSWFVHNTTSGTAQSILTNMQSAYDGVYLCSRSNSTVTLQACKYGKAYNAPFSAFNSSITVTNATGGRPAPLTGIIFSSQTLSSSSMIFATATVKGAITYTIASTTPTALVVTGIDSGSDGQVQYSPFNTITSSQTYPNGLSVLFTISAGTAPAGLTKNTTYYVFGSNGSTLQLATSKTNAINGAPIQLTDSTLDKGSFKLSPLGLNGNTTFQWQCSNDGLNYYDMTISSIAITPTTSWSNYVWDIGKYNYEYIRVKLSATSFGSVFLKIIGLGRKVAP